MYFIHAEPDGVLSYDVANGVWQQFLVPPPLHLADHMLAEYALVGLVIKNAATSVYILELQRMTLMWKQAGRMLNIW